MCVLGGFLIDNRISEVWSIIGFGVLGYAMVRNGFALGPFVLGVILGPIAELSLRSGLTASGGSLMPLVTRPVPIIFILLGLFLPFLPKFQAWRRERRRAKAAAKG